MSGQGCMQPLPSMHTIAAPSSPHALWRSAIELLASTFIIPHPLDSNAPLLTLSTSSSNACSTATLPLALVSTNRQPCARANCTPTSVDTSRCSACGRDRTCKEGVLLME